MDVPAAVDGLNTGLGFQYRSALEATLVAGSLRGLQWEPVARQLRVDAAAELNDLRHLVERVVALGATTLSSPRAFSAGADAQQAMRTLIAHECEALTAMHGVIAASGQEPRSEALEHRMEHVILREQEQIDALRRILDVPPEE